MSNRKYCLHTLAVVIDQVEINDHITYMHWCPSCGSYQSGGNEKPKLQDWYNPKGVYNKEDWQRRGY